MWDDVGIKWDWKFIFCLYAAYIFANIFYIFIFASIPRKHTSRASRCTSCRRQETAARLNAKCLLPIERWIIIKELRFEKCYNNKKKTLFHTHRRGTRLLRLTWREANMWTCWRQTIASDWTMGLLCCCSRAQADKSDERAAVMFPELSKEHKK